MNILITGVSRGLGKALNDTLVKQNVNVFGVSRGGANDFTLSQKGARKFMFDWKDYDALAAAFKKELGADRLDVVINNAGVLWKADIENLEEHSFTEQIRINAWLPVRLFQTLYKNQLLKPNAHIINIGSMGGVQGAEKFPGLAAYAASKAALAAITEALHAEYGAFGLSFNYLALGAVNTEMLKEAFPGYISQVDPENMAEFIADFARTSGQIMSGRILQVAKSDPKT